jgi:hypothetical protein
MIHLVNRALAVLVGVLILSTRAYAAPVNFFYAGTVNFASDGFEHLLGLPISLEIILELSTPDEEEEPEFGDYPSSNTLVIKVGGNEFVTAPGRTFINVDIGGLSYQFSSSEVRGPAINGLQPDFAAFNLNIPKDPEAIRSDQLPSRPPDPADFVESVFDLIFCEIPDFPNQCGGGGIGAFDNWRIAPRTVPEPSVLMLLGAVACFLASVVRRSIKQRRS